MFQNQNGAIKVIGLDTFDPNGASNLTKQGDLQSLNVLKSTNAMTVFAEKAVRSVEMEITDAMRKAKVSFTVACNNQPVKIDEHSEGFLAGYVGDLVSGLQDGANGLKIYLQGKKKQYGVPPPPVPQRGQAPVMGGHRVATPPPRPVMGGHRTPPVPPPRVMPPLPAVPAASTSGKTIPQGILDRMAYLGW
jgi:hypothetical protein